MADDATDLAAGSVAGRGGGFFSRGIKRITGATLSAKVTTEGVRNLTREFSGLHDVLKKVRGELEQINRQASGTSGMGVGQGTPTGAAGTTGAVAPTGGAGMVGRIAGMFGGGGWGGQGSPVRGAGGFNYGAAAVTGAAIISGGANIIEDRFMRNVAQSAPISAVDVRTASMYGPQLYRGMEMRRFTAGGEYIGSREGAQAAQQVALGFGATMAGSQRFMPQVGGMVQASGGTLGGAQAAAQVGLFAAPEVSNRARAMGIMTYKDQGVLANPMRVGLDYVKDYEKRYGVTMNEMDFANLRAPGSGHRMRMKQIYGLSDEAIDMVINAGMQNMQFRGTAAGRGGRTINFGSPADLEAIGLKPSALGLQAARFGTTAQRREARFFENQEGAMSERLNQERMIQEALSDTEQAFGDLIGYMHEFQRVLQAVTTGLGVLGGLSMLSGGMGGGGGLLGKLFGGAGGAATAAEGAAAAAGGATGGGGAMGLMGKLGLGAAGLGIGIAGVHTAATAKTPGGMAFGIGTATAGGAMLGTAIAPGVGTLIGAGVGAAVGTTFAAINYFKGVDAKNVADGYSEGVGMTDKVLIDSIQDYVKNAKVGLKGEGAGAKQRGRFDAFARRRGSLLASALDEAQSTGKFTNLSTQDATELGELVAFFGSDGVFDDSKLWSNKSRAEKYIGKIRGTEVWRKYFNAVADPFGFTPVTTAQSDSLIMSAEESYQAAVSGGQTGDAVFALTEGSERPTRRIAKAGINNRPTWGDGIEDKALSRGDSWNFLDSRMKTRLLAMFRASGGRVGLQAGGGWRSTARQREMFLERHREDPNGSIEWEGKRWSLIPGNAAAAPPGRSYHEIGLAADLEGDLGWMNAHAGEFQLIHFANVNDEPWHVQPAEIPRGRSEFTGPYDGGGPDGGGGTVPGAPGAAAAPQPFGGGGGGGASGINYSIAAAAQAVSAPGGVGAAPTAAGVGGGTGGPPWGGTWPGDMREKGMAVAKVAANVGNFHGEDLYQAIAIAKRESQWDPTAYNGVGRDNSYGLWQINMIGDMGPDRAGRLGIDTSPPYDELKNPNTNAKAARMVFDDAGGNWGPWTTAAGVNPADIAEAKQLAAAANVGDAVFDRGLTSGPTVGGSANVNIGVTINSTGNVRYDAEALGEAVRPVLSNVMAEISTKRGS